MAPQDYVDIENRLSAAMLREVAVNPKIKQVLHELAAVLIPKVVVPIREATIDCEKFTDLPVYIQKSLHELAENHSWQLRQLGALLPEIGTAQEIVNNNDKIQQLLTKIMDVISGTSVIYDANKVASQLKTLIDLCRCYFEFFPAHVHQPGYIHLKKVLWPTPEEIDFRIKRAELGEESQLVIGKKGIGTQPNVDLVPEHRQQGQHEGRMAGKSIFWGCDMGKRLQLIMNSFDENMQDIEVQASVAEYQRLKSLLFYTKNILDSVSVELDAEKLLHIELKIDALTQRLDEVMAVCPPALEKMEYYHIPINVTERRSAAEHAELCEPVFNKLAKLSGLSLPLIASISGSTLRTLITLHDMGVFNRDGVFDVDKIQIMANCIMGFFIQSGHHSYFEVAEAYNRYLDYLVLEYQAMQLPYYLMGDYRSFLQQSYADRVIEQAGVREFLKLSLSASRA